MDAPHESAGPTPEDGEACRIESAMGVLGGRWTGPLVWWLRDGPRRFGELRRLESGVTPKVLTQTLRQLERDGLVVRRAWEVPPRVEYELSELGRSAIGVLDAVAGWWSEHAPAVAAARDIADARADPRADARADAQAD